MTTTSHTQVTPIRIRLNEVLIDLELTHDRQEGLQGALRSVISELFEEGFDHPNLKALYYLTTTIRDEHKRAHGQIEKLRKVRAEV
ncbi:hypothetical protein [uncultured Roseibium sp.]|uniref:hypothetical protein n=1 Tax=uncultured Roseibium sp. TaxID=1936171 RepID=UPI00261117AA|nr:hypothetical protein [uncultured Roseibium sp.]